MNQGPTIVSDVVDVYIFRRTPGPDRFAFLQLLRSRAPLLGTWQPVMGHIEPGETAVATALREVAEEVGLMIETRAGRAQMVQFFALEQVHPFFLAEQNMVVQSPRFGLEVGPRWEAVLNHEHSAARWVSGCEAHAFAWPGQLACVREVMAMATRGLVEGLRPQAWPTSEQTR